MRRLRSWVVLALFGGLVAGGLVVGTAQQPASAGMPSVAAASMSLSSGALSSGAASTSLASAVRTDNGGQGGDGEHWPPPAPFHVTSPADGAVVTGPVTTIAGTGGGPSTPVVVFVDHHHWCTSGWLRNLTWSCSGPPVTAPGLHTIDVYRLAYGDWFGHSTFTIATPPPVPKAPGILGIDGVANGALSVPSSSVAGGLRVSGSAVYDPHFAARVSVSSSFGGCSSAVAASGAYSCTLPRPATGTSTVTVTETIAGASASTPFTLTVVDDTPVPPANPVPPSIISVAGVHAGVKTVTTSSLGSGLLVSGTAAYDPNHEATVTIRLTDAGTSCTAPVASSGAYACVLPKPSVGHHTLTVTESIDGAEATETVDLTVIDDSTTPLRTFGSWALSITDGFGVSLGSHTVQVGGTIIVTGHGIGTDASVVIELHSTPVVLAQLASTGGSFTRSAVIPADTDVGDHTVVVLVSAPGYTTDERDVAITVTPATVAAATPQAAVVTPQSAPSPEAAAPAPLPGVVPVPSTPAPAPKADAPAKTYTVHNTAKLDGDQRTILSQLPAMSDITLGAPQVAAAGGLVAGLIFLIALPAILLEATLRENYERIFKFAEPIRRVLRPLGTRVTSRTSGFWAWVSLYTVIVAFILSFADPNVAPDLKSLRLVLALVAAQVLHDLVLVLISGRLAKAELHMAVTPVLRPGGIVFVVGGVVVTRMLGLEPGVLFGAWLVLMAMGSSTGQRGKLSLIRAAVLVCVGLLAWAGYSLLTAGADSFWSLLGVESLSAVMIGALSELVIAMLPLTFLEGHEIWEWSKWAWVGTYVMVAALFTIVVLPQPEAWIDLSTPAIVLGSIFGSFGLVCIGVWAWFRFTTSKALVVEEEERDVAA